MTKFILPGALAIAVLAAWPHAQQPPPASQQPPQRPGEGCVSLPDDWGKNANPNWEPPEPE